ncbi:MAG TPA: N-acetylmuramidase domain-containing protein [Aggregatilineales bacterium]|nr:N-acetylmuramidase domain-containing protein [Aggregatilineales bacterium]
MEKFGVVTSAKLNLRDQPASDSNILTQLSKDTVLDILADAGWGWLKVRVEGSTTTGYVSKLYLSLTDTRPVAAPNPDAPSEGEKAQVSVARLNLRSTPSTDGSVLAKLPQNTLLDVIAVQGDWLQVSANGLQGYVAAAYVTLILPGAPVTPAQPPSGFLINQPELLNATLVPDSLIPDQTDNNAALIARTWNSFGGLIGLLASRLNTGRDALVGVLAAESGGRAFAADGRMIIRFENHVFYQYWGKNNAARYAQYFKFDQSAPANSWKGHQWRPDPKGPWQICHTSQDMEWQVLTFARTLDDTAALESISMGAPQIMGFNFRRLGYASVQDMFKNFAASAPAQILALFDFVRGPNTIAALQKGDYLAFATAYNGPANAATYRDIIQRYSSLFHQLIGSV